MSTTPNPIHAAVAQIMGGGMKLGKDGTNQMQKYKFTSVDSMLDAIRGPLSEHGVTITQSHKDILSDTESETRSGSKMRDLIVLFTFTLTHAESGLQEQYDFAGQGADTGDKCYSKASTSAEKFFVRRLFLMTTGDEDPDSTVYERATSSTRTAATPQPEPPWKKRWEEAKARVGEKQAIALLNKSPANMLNDDNTWAAFQKLMDK